MEGPWRLPIWCEAAAAARKYIIVSQCNETLDNRALVCRSGTGSKDCSSKNSVTKRVISCREQKSNRATGHLKRKFHRMKPSGLRGLSEDKERIGDLEAMEVKYFNNLTVQS